MMSDEQCKIPKTKTQQRSKLDHPWLIFTSSGMKCKAVCCDWLLKIEGCKNFSNRFIYIIGSSNYKTSAVKDHETSDQHKRSMGNQEILEAEKAGVSIAKKFVRQKAPEDSTIMQSFKKMSEGERESLVKLFLPSLRHC